MFSVMLLGQQGKHMFTPGTCLASTVSHTMTRLYSQFVMETQDHVSGKAGACAQCVKYSSQLASVSSLQELCSSISTEL